MLFVCLFVYFFIILTFRRSKKGGWSNLVPRVSPPRDSKTDGPGSEVVGKNQKFEEGTHFMMLKLSVAVHLSHKKLDLS